MKTNTTKPSAAAAAALALALALALGSTGVSQAESCLDRRQIQEEVTAGKIKSLDAALASAGVDASAKILNVQVCDQGGQLVYIIGMLSSDGQAENRVVSAQ